MAMDNTSKQSILNNSAYGSRLAQKQAIYNNSQYAQVQSAVSGDTSKKTNTYTLANGKVLVRNTQSNKINFKTLFASLHDDVDNTTAINNFKTISDNMASAYAKINKSYINKSINS
jgi:hypothetical protein